LDLIAAPEPLADFYLTAAAEPLADSAAAYWGTSKVVTCSLRSADSTI
jgi:hypothetical protein